MTDAIEGQAGDTLEKVEAALPPVLAKIIVVLSLIALMLALWLQRQEPGRELFLSLNAWATQWPPASVSLGALPNLPAAFWSFFTLLGEVGVLFCLLSPLLVVRPRMMFSVLAAVPLGAVLSVSLKAFFSTPRPAAMLDNSLFTLIGPLLHKTSFPSGHTIAAFSAAVAVLVCLAAAHKQGRSALAAAVILGLAAGVGLSRIAVGAHWPVDVLAGAACGSLAGLSGAWLMGRYPALWQSKAGQFVVGQALLITALWLLLHKPDLPQGILAVWLAVAGVIWTVLTQFVRLWPQKRH